MPGSTAKPPTSRARVAQSKTGPVSMPALRAETRALASAGSGTAAGFEQFLLEEVDRAGARPLSAA